MRTCMRNLTLVAAALLGAALTGHSQDTRTEQPGRPQREAAPRQLARADEPRKDAEKIKVLMRRKLENSEKILEALSLNDMAAAGKHASELLKIRKDPVFRVIKTPEYELWSDEFTRAAEGIVKAGKDKNLEAGKLAYLGMTLSCFNCHAYVRDLKKTRD